MSTVLEFVEHPKFKVAHPDDDTANPVRCPYCVIARDPKSDRKFMLWGSNGGRNWSLSRHDPAYGSDLRLGDIELVGR